jgi:pimeloyl-ACP methyl ester carboxylesterase
LEEVVAYLKNYPKINNIALWGRSMGAVTALLYLAKHDGVKAAIFDSPFKSLKALVEDMAQKTSKIPKLVLNGALKIISGTIQQKADFSIYDLNPLKYAAPKLTIPAFFIVGIDDEVIPIEHTKDLFEAYGGDKKIIKMVKGRHNENRPSECIREVVRFLIDKFNSKEEMLQKKEET